MFRHLVALGRRGCPWQRQPLIARAARPANPVRPCLEEGEPRHTPRVNARPSASFSPPTPSPGTTPLDPFDERLRNLVRTPPGPHGLWEGLAVSIMLACVLYFVCLCWEAGREIRARHQQPAAKPAPAARHSTP
jgi:hypothetical protein